MPQAVVSAGVSLIHRRGLRGCRRRQRNNLRGRGWLHNQRSLGVGQEQISAE